MKQSHSKKIKASVKAAYKAIAADFDQTRKRPWGEFEDFLSHVKSGDHVLDLGCGNGRLFDFFHEKGLKINYLGVDHNPDFLKLAKKNVPEATFQEGDLENPGLKDSSFDVIFSVAAFHHLPDITSRNKCVAAMHQALKKEGLVVLTTWNLWQKRYWKEWVRAALLSFVTLGRGLKWNDLWIKWGKSPLKRYYHSFFPKELLRYFPKSNWKVEGIFFSKKGKKVSFWKCFNIVLVVRKK